MRSRWPILALLCVLASLLVPGIASPSTAASAETRVWAFDFAEQVRVGGSAALTPELRPGCKPTYDQLASNSLLAARRVIASEKRAKSISKRIERELGKDARRAFHDMKEGGVGDRTVQELLDDARSLYEMAGKEVPKWLR